MTQANNNVELFPARIASRVVKASNAEKSGTPGMGGYSPEGYSPEMDTAFIPTSDTAYARVIRMHESGHAIWSRESKVMPDDFIGQAVEDVKIHGLLETEGSVRRDELYAAISDLRIVERNIRKDSPDRALQGISLLRAASIISKPETSELGAYKLVDVAQQYHPQGMELCASILAEVAAGNIDLAKALTSKLFANSPVEQKDKGEGQSESDDAQDGEGNGESDGEGQDGEDGQDGEEKSGDSPSGKPKPSKKSKGGKDSKWGKWMDRLLGGTMASGEKKFDAPKYDDIELEPIPDKYKGGRKGDYIPVAVKIGEKIQNLEDARRDSEDGTVVGIVVEVGQAEREDYAKWIPNPVMYVHTLSPNVSRRVHGRGRNIWRSAEQGIKIRANRLALNAASPFGGSRLFETRHIGGTVLLDASGSMHIQDKHLYEIAEKFPAGKVAYYSGVTDGWSLGSDRYKRHTAEELEEQWTGNLIVYAQNGKIRKDHGAKLPKRHSGNLVDYHAILWLLKQPGPRYMMTDWGFTGPLSEAATNLLKSAEESKRIKVFQNMPLLMDEVGKLR